MNAAALLAELRSRDIRVWAVGGELHCDAPSGSLTPELQARLRQQKKEILDLLTSAQALAAQPRALVPLQRAGKQPAIFAVPGHNGDVFCYRALAQALGTEQPFFGLQAPGLDGDAEPFRRVEALAAYFAGQVRAFQPDGPYIIAGFCAGGTVAFELAQQLLRSGAEVRLVALFGSPYPSYFRVSTQLRQQVANQISRLRTVARELLSPAPGRGRGYVAEKLRQQQARRKAARAARADPVLARRAKVERATVGAVRQYSPRRFAGRVCLFLPGPQWQRSGVGAQRWRRVAAHAEEYFGPEASHGDDMLREHAPAFADLLRRCCEKSEARSPSELGPGPKDFPPRRHAHTTCMHSS